MNGDAEFLGLTESGDEAGRYGFTVVERLSRPDGFLYGGTAIAVSVAAAEAVSDRKTVWMTTQFVSSVAQDSQVSVHAEVLAGGKRTNQVRVTATSEDGDIVFASLGATAAERPDALNGVLESAPKVKGPDQGDTGVSPFQSMTKAAGFEGDLPRMPLAGFMLASEMHVASGIDGDAGLCLWARRRDRLPITPAIAAFLADLVPMGISHGLGVMAAGTSLDNTIRIGSFTEPEWVLIEIRPHFAANGYGHGTAHVWDPDGNLLATASQTASMFVFDPANLPWAASPGA